MLTCLPRPAVLVCLLHIVSGALSASHTVTGTATYTAVRTSSPTSSASRTQTPTQTGSPSLTPTQTSAALPSVLVKGRLVPGQLVTVSLAEGATALFWLSPSFPYGVTVTVAPAVGDADLFVSATIGGALRQNGATADYASAQPGNATELVTLPSAYAWSTPTAWVAVSSYTNTSWTLTAAWVTTDPVLALYARAAGPRFGGPCAPAPISFGPSPPLALSPPWGSSGYVPPCAQGATTPTSAYCYVVAGAVAPFGYSAMLSVNGFSAQNAYAAVPAALLYITLANGSSVVSGLAGSYNNGGYTGVSTQTATVSAPGGASTYVVDVLPYCGTYMSDYSLTLTANVAPPAGGGGDGGGGSGGSAGAGVVAGAVVGVAAAAVLVVAAAVAIQWRRLRYVPLSLPQRNNDGDVRDSVMEGSNTPTFATPAVAVPSQGGAALGGGGDAIAAWPEAAPPSVADGNRARWADAVPFAVAGAGGSDFGELTPPAAADASRAPAAVDAGVAGGGGVPSTDAAADPEDPECAGLRGKKTVALQAAVDAAPSAPIVSAPPAFPVAAARRVEPDADIVDEPSLDA